ncbi:MAG: Fic family protein [Vicinamibacterales bacterium]
MAPITEALFQPPEIDPQEEAVMARIEEVRKTLSYATSSRRWTGVLAKMTLAKGIQGSNSIEGYNVTDDDAMAAVEREEMLDADTETVAALNGYRAAMSYVLQLSDDPHFSYSRGLIRSLHFIMVGYDLTKNPGKWRPGPIFVRNDNTGDRVYEGPGSERVNDLMHALVNNLNSTQAPPLVSAAMAHLNLVMIHPFSDGNGRMGRALQTLVLSRSGILAKEFCSIEEYLGRNRQPYYDVLAEVGAGAWHPERDTRMWIRFCLTAHFRQASTLVRRARIIQKLWDSLEHLIKLKALPDRTITVLAEAAMGYGVRNATYRKSADISDTVASRDLKALTEAGLLMASGEKRGRRYSAAETLQKLGREAAANEPKRIEDPFESKDYLPGLAPLR